MSLMYISVHAYQRTRTILRSHHHPGDGASKQKKTKIEEARELIASSVLTHVTATAFNFKVKVKYPVISTKLFVMKLANATSFSRTRSVYIT